MMKHDEIVGFVGTGISTALTITQTNEVFQLIQLILSILAFLVTICFTIWKWYKKAKEDGKITLDEVEELFDNLEDNIKHDNIKEENKNGNKGNR